jgi:Uma2 family endonuclease
MQLALKPQLTAADYLDGERTSDTRHEFVDGHVFAMAGAGESHNLITGNVFAKLRNLVRGGPCRVFISDMKLNVVEWNAFYYPDVMVVCDADDTQPYFKQSPCLVVEVLSPSTASTDRREKMLAYRTVPSLRDYLLISQDKRRVELFRRAADGTWAEAVVVDAGEVALESVQTSLALNDIYEDVKLVPNKTLTLMGLA